MTSDLRVALRRRPVDPARCCLRPDEWPRPDREAWVLGTRPGDPLDDPRRADTLSARSLNKTADGYGRWLGFLRYHGHDLDVPPSDRVDPGRVAAFLRHMRDLGNRDFTIVSRLQELQTALEIIAPERDWAWIRTPGGHSVRSCLPMRKRDLFVPHPRLLYRLGLRWMDEATAMTAPQRRRVRHRDGLLFAILAARGMRLRSVAAIRLGVQLQRGNDGWALDFERGDTKTGRTLGYPLPASLTPHLDRHLEVERRELLAGRSSDALWIGWDGAAMSLRGLEKRIYWHSRRSFPAPFGPHRFRHAIATHTPITDGAPAGIAAAVLGISGGVLAEHYDRSDNANAARAHLDLIQAERDAMEPIARNGRCHR